MNKKGRVPVFLVIVDNTEEFKIAFHFACIRARKVKARIALLYVLEPTNFEHWLSVGDMIRSDNREHAEKRLGNIGEKALKETGNYPIFHIREGKVKDELMALMEEDSTISLLFVGSKSGAKGPGEFVLSLANISGRISAPVVLVPGALTDEEIENLI